ncbi:hypothetical protein O7627_16685 [Solwaraspora sp. WMMD1047]|uniref:hypothetical protein n=1 Tax=Solwaraspora sp. WMMD1047 TaxID=3016102 RepID=UPI0024172DE3|nr:hypothetical protein [Solwaraspora sp. WMMD1047]MDG4830932.1 hypothetical protein [Solwaraspora sp. WMMD1047]
METAFWIGGLIVAVIVVMMFINLVTGRGSGHPTDNPQRTHDAYHGAAGAGGVTDSWGGDSGGGFSGGGDGGGGGGGGS